jgi:hypothetical protein
MTSSEASGEGRGFNSPRRDRWRAACRVARLAEEMTLLWLSRFVGSGSFAPFRLCAAHFRSTSGNRPSTKRERRRRISAARHTAPADGVPSLASALVR